MRRCFYWGLAWCSSPSARAGEADVSVGSITERKPTDSRRQKMVPALLRTPWFAILCPH